MSTLYIIATPIGNLEDITLRAVRVLKEVDFIICEDTRVTSKLLAHYQIQKPLVSYFQHSKLSRVEEIMARLRRGESAALVTDAGTPGISDPGGVLVSQIIRQLGNQVKVVPIPGPSAVITALSISGLPADSFLFLGFPPHKKGRQKFWKRVAESVETVVFYESRYRISKALEELTVILSASEGSRTSPEANAPRAQNASSADKLRDSSPPKADQNDKVRKVVVCRELTKMFESVYRGTIEEVKAMVAKDPQKGEYVVIVQGAH